MTRTPQQSSPTTTASVPAFAANLSHGVQETPRVRSITAVLSGILLSVCFPPLCQSWLAWVVFVPFMCIPASRSKLNQAIIGYVFGFAHFATLLLWLNEVGFGAGFILGAVCAFFPMIWYLFFCGVTNTLRDVRDENLMGISLMGVQNEWRLCLLVILASSAWTALEWVRSWIFTGFSWGQLGISQFMNTRLIQHAAYTGVFGTSFLVIAVNLLVAALITRAMIVFCPRQRVNEQMPCQNYWQEWRRVQGVYSVWILGIVLFAFFWFLQVNDAPDANTPENSIPLRALVIQGNLPQQRFWTEEIVRNSMTRYGDLTQKGMVDLQQRGQSAPDLVIWPESAIPAPLDYPDYRQWRNALLRTYPQTQFLIGALQYRGTSEEDAKSFNSVFLMDVNSPVQKRLLNPADYITDYYDKVHRVPFGEYTPFASVFPWLPELIGMGRDLTPGRDFHVMTLPHDIRAGVNICFEDVFPDVSRAFARRGAQLLLTITNDSWYNQSAGAHQHASHVIFRAVENHRPFLRCGSNSHTTYVSPNGAFVPFKQDTAPDNPHPDFFADARLFELRVPKVLPTTFYTRYGDLFSWLCAVISCAALCAMTRGMLLERHRRRLEVFGSAA